MMLRDASWVVSAFLILTMAFAGMCSRHIDKHNARKSRKSFEKHYKTRPSDVTNPARADNKIVKELQIPKERIYKPPRDYIIDQ